MDDITENSTGMRVRRARKYRGMTLEVLAGRVGKSKAWLSMIENGRLPLEKRSDIAALADALEVPASDLLTRPFPVFSKGAPDVSDVRESLMENSLDAPAAVASRPLAAVGAEDMAALTAAWRAGDHERQAVMLGPLLGELHAHAAAGKGRTQALELLTRASVFASDLAKELGQIDLAWIAADRARQAARAHGGAAVTGMAAWAVAMARPVAARSRALMGAGDAAGEMKGSLGRDDPLGWQVYGMLCLTAALGSHLAGDRDGSAAHLDEAGRVARKAGEQPQPWEAFGPANAGVWSVTLAVEAGEPGLALERARLVNPADLVSAGDRKSVV